MNTIIEKFNSECTTYLNTELNTRLLALSLTSIDKTTSEHYLNEYKQCLDEQMNFVNYINEQMESLNQLKSCDTAIDTFLERLKAIHEYELKQNEIFEQILNELTKINPSSKEERQRLLQQIDELIACKTKLTNVDSNEKSTTNKLQPNSSDTFKIIL
ncbi:unnamed protein product [Rotaria socialis]|uniref:Uncharacterized protein n=1 Tax=Rotaria socialis TaxID=392032 RepID=A0A820LVH3_9BILA|nr:unnamed protein product [Rotaria socialis]CAF3452091.1 unnamed protein product [Rotaria socialis]CAF3558989.1 unnamed protein product [Rotaria socialis]CAF3621815.1 unnamed protein product [Rotaria socialis]CAF4112604.1 unnamed protein product [Rotaria socialis]